MVRNKGECKYKMGVWNSSDCAGMHQHNFRQIGRERESSASRGADLEEVGDFKYTPLIQAAENGHTDVCAFLLPDCSCDSIQCAGLF